MLKLALPLFVILLSIRDVDSKTFSCFGYVKSSGIDVDLSKVQVKLFTAQGNLKYETECNIADGFYTIPVYSKGKYVIKVIAPDGWVFEQDSQSIEVDDDVVNSCEKDINFSLNGFVISGIVRSGAAPGPKGFLLALHNAQDRRLVSSTSTGEGGVYKFVAKPGSYEISTEDQSTQCINGKVRVNVLQAPVNVNPDIQIFGYNLKIFVQDQKGAAIIGATVVLASSSKLKFDNIPVHAPQPHILPQNDRSQWQYSLKTDTKEVVQFFCLPPDTYTVKASWTSGDLQLNFGAEKEIKIDFNMAEVVIRAKSFNIGSEILHGSTPIAGVSILVNGKLKAISDSAGKFVLNDLVESSYHISASKKHYEFSEFDTVLTPTESLSLPKLKINRISICGSIEYDTSKDSYQSSLQVTIRSVDSNKDQTNPIEVDDNTHRFCELLAPGSYIVSLAKSASYSFSPKSVRVDLNSVPILDIKFTQFKASIEGSVSCIENCKTVVVQLMQNSEIIEEQSTTSMFKFTDVVPAVYIKSLVQIRDDYNFWWETPKQSVEVFDKDIKDLVFRQSGYKTEIQSTHPCTFKYSLDVEKTQKSEQNLNEGVNYVFFPRSGKYDFVVDSCHQFSLQSENSDAVFQTLVVPTTEHLVLKAVKSQVTVSITTGKPSNDAKFQLLVRSSSGEIIVQETSNTKGTNHSFLFYLDHHSVGETFTIIPQSAKYIFLPLSATFTFNGECQDNIAIFKSEIGKVISGSVSPPVQGILVKAISRNQADGEPIVLKTESDANGKYKIGPVWDLNEWQVALEKTGYEFKSVPSNNEPYNFKSIKLSHLKIFFADVESTKPLTNVLVSISGPENYRLSSITNADGVLTIIGLASGEYFVRPILQEYKFNATSYGVYINEGETKDVTLYAKKFAYSVFGKVTTITKQPITDIVHVEAVSKQCNNHQEEDSTDSNISTFRIRGLLPECSYRVSLKNEEGYRIKSYPPFIDVTTGNEDKYDVNFVITPVESRTTVFGKLEFVQQNQQQQSGTYSIQLFEGYGQSFIQEVVVKSPSTVFMFNNLVLNKHNYTVRIDRSEARRRGIEPVVVEFSADSSFKYIKLVIRPVKQVAEVEVSKTNILGLFIIFVIAFWFLNQNKAKLITEWVLATLQTLLNARNDGDLGGYDGDNRKRKAKKQ